MKQFLITAATTALIATGAWASTDQAGADDTADMGVDNEGDITASRGAAMPTSAEVLGVDEEGYLIDSQGYYLVDMEGNAIQADLSKRKAGADDTALMGVDAEGNITASRGEDNPTAPETTD